MEELVGIVGIYSHKMTDSCYLLIGRVCGELKGFVGLSMGNENTNVRVGRYAGTYLTVSAAGGVRSVQESESASGSEHSANRIRESFIGSPRL